MAMVGGYAKLTHDVLPFTIADGMPAEPRAVNKIGMRRNGMGKEEIRTVEEAFSVLFRSNLTLKDATNRLRDEHPESSSISHLLQFIADSKRGLARPKQAS